ncbi:hypothetical protein K9L97_03800 [Candidatus Woesearchaeota archaeon]|nr:hypothetical protein [Candidatus Woesearchaeota archaeon]
MNFTKKRGQSAIEFLTIVAISLILIIPAASTVLKNSEQNQKEIETQQLITIGTEILTAAEEMNILGEGSYIILDMQTPESLESVKIRKTGENQGELIFTQKFSEKLNDIVFFSENFNLLVGTSEQNCETEICEVILQTTINSLKIQKTSEGIKLEKEYQELTPICQSGNECLSRLCIEGICKENCENGKQCSQNSDNSYTDFGICTFYDGNQICDTEIARKTGNAIYGSCYDTMRKEYLQGYQCDPNSLAGGFTTEGTCRTEEEKCVDCKGITTETKFTNPKIVISSKEYSLCDDAISMDQFCIENKYDYYESKNPSGGTNDGAKYNMITQKWTAQSCTTVQITCKKCVECTENAHCSPDYMCNENNECVQCITNDDCEPGFLCNTNNECKCISIEKNIFDPQKTISGTEYYLQNDETTATQYATEKGGTYKDKTSISITKRDAAKYKGEWIFEPTTQIISQLSYDVCVECTEDAHCLGGTTCNENNECVCPNGNTCTLDGKQGICTSDGTKNSCDTEIASYYEEIYYKDCTGKPDYTECDSNNLITGYDQNGYCYKNKCVEECTNGQSCDLEKDSGLCTEQNGMQICDLNLAASSRTGHLYSNCISSTTGQDCQKGSLASGTFIPDGSCTEDEICAECTMDSECYSNQGNKICYENTCDIKACGPSQTTTPCPENTYCIVFDEALDQYFCKTECNTGKYYYDSTTEEIKPCQATDTK